MPKTKPAELEGDVDVDTLNVHSAARIAVRFQVSIDRVLQAIGARDVQAALIINDQAHYDEAAIEIIVDELAAQDERRAAQSRHFSVSKRRHLDRIAAASHAHIVSTGKRLALVVHGVDLDFAEAQAVAMEVAERTGERADVWSVALPARGAGGMVSTWNSKEHSVPS